MYKGQGAMMAVMDALVELWHLYRWHVFVLLGAVAVASFSSNSARNSKRDSRRTMLEEKDHAAYAASNVRKMPDGALAIALEQGKLVLVDADLLPSKVTAAPLHASQALKKPTAGPKRIQGRKQSPKSRATTRAAPETIQPLVFFSSLGGTTEHTVNQFSQDLTSTSSSHDNILPPQVLDLAQIEHDDYFTSTPTPSASCQSTSYFYILLIPTYNIDTILDNLIEHLKDVHHDFRIDTAPLQSLLGYAVFGFGDKEGWPTEAEGFCSQASEVDKWMARLTGSKRAYPVGMGDVKRDVDERLGDWRVGVTEVLKDVASGGSLGEGVHGSGEAVESDVDEEDDAEMEEQQEEVDMAVTKKRRLKKTPAKSSTLADLESLSFETDFTTTTTKTSTKTSTSTPSAQPPSQPKAMVPVTSPTYQALTKQGYTIIGTHSGVKICRWTKSALRGRGSCYKYSFYGIASHLCMETTPSLSCSNKCVFCWRHGTNPVGTTWRWQVDPPDLIFNGAKEGHYKKIKMMRGVPGVRAERFEEAMRIRHCALSLVGEPIFYPHINEFLSLLHAERISSFLVCNAQHPAQLAALKKVTQLYVSIDASNKDSLRKIDRPLHRDFWERFCACLDILREKRYQQRTVFRLTLVKGFNIDDEAEGYADLVERGLPCFVEVKGVTYCGTSTSKGAGLSMQNVPFYEEVCAFVEALNAALARRGLGYGIAAEHAHSCCILLASDRFRSPEGRWKSVIDYQRFFELLESGKEFAPEDYCKETQEWALYGNGGFDPRDERVRLKGANKTKKAVVNGVVNGEPVVVEP